MEYISHTDHFYHNIILKISPVDLFNLKRTNKLFSNIIKIGTVKKLILHYINKRLFLIFGDDTNKFKQILNDTKTVISGSFLIQCILGEYWNNSDIDIYSPMVDSLFTDIETFLYEKYEHRETFNSHTYGDDLSNYKTHIKWVRSYKNNSNELQVIQVGVENSYIKMKEFIHNSFDFDICKNMYYIDNKNENVSIFKLNNIFNRIEKFKTRYNLDTSIGRCIKYRKRGFDIYNNKTYEALENLSYNGYGKKTHELYNIKETNGLYKITSGNIDILKTNDTNIILTCSGEHYMRNFPYSSSYGCDKTCLIKFCDPNIKHYHLKIYKTPPIHLLFIWTK